MTFRSFGPQTFLIAWSRYWVRHVTNAVENGHAPLAGVRLQIIKEIDATEALLTGGDVWVAVSLPIELFLRIERDHLHDQGALDLAQAVSAVLKNLLPQDFEDDPMPPLPETRPRRGKTRRDKFRKGLLDPTDTGLKIRDPYRAASPNRFQNYVNRMQIFPFYMCMILSAMFIYA